MKVIVAGCGKVGKTIIASMVKENHDVVAMDTNPKVVSAVNNEYDVMSLCGNATSYDDLKEAGAGGCDIFIAVTSSDELNMLACFAAKRMGAKYTVARIREAEYNKKSLVFMKEQLEISLVLNPEKLTSEALYNLLKLPSACKVETFADRRLEMIELIVRKKTPLDGVRLSEIRKKQSYKFLVCEVQRGDEVFIPNGNFLIHSGDKVGIMCEREETHRTLKTLGFLQKECKEAIILGGGKIAYYLAQKLSENHSAVKIIEKNEDKCVELCENLPSQVTVVHGNGMSQDLLSEEGIDGTDAFIALTGKDEENILISFYAISRQVPKIVCKVNTEELSAIAEKLGMDSIITPKRLVADVLVRYARALQNSMGSTVEKLYSIAGGQVEALEFIVTDKFEYSSVPLKNLKLKEDVLVAGIIRQGQTLVPGGDDYIIPGDRVVVFAKGNRIGTLSDAISERRSAENK